MLGTTVGRGWFYSLVLDVLLFRQALSQHLGVSGDIAAGSSSVTLSLEPSAGCGQVM